nr:hypothetical protein [Tanacetum cinerariifolium]
QSPVEFMDALIESEGKAAMLKKNIKLSFTFNLDLIEGRQDAKSLQLGHFARECNVKKVDEKARYSAFKISEVKIEDPKAMVSVDSMLNWNEHEAENKTEKGISPKVQTCPFGCDSQLSELKKNYDHLEKLYNDSFIQV